MKLEGNVLRNLRPAMLQMLLGKDIQISMISKYSWYPNIHDIQIFMTSKYPWYPNIYDIQISMISKYPWYPNIHDIQISMMSLSQNCGRTCHMWSHLSHMVTLVTSGHNCHMWSHLSHVVTLVTYGHTCHKKSIYQLLTKKCMGCLKKNTTNV